jgi:hypothetical protein
MLPQPMESQVECHPRFFGLFFKISAARRSQLNSFYLKYNFITGLTWLESPNLLLTHYRVSVGGMGAER